MYKASGGCTASNAKVMVPCWWQMVGKFADWWWKPWGFATALHGSIKQRCKQRNKETTQKKNLKKNWNNISKEVASQRNLWGLDVQDGHSQHVYKCNPWIEFLWLDLFTLFENPLTAGWLSPDPATATTFIWCSGTSSPLDNVNNACRPLVIRIMRTGSAESQNTFWQEYRVTNQRVIVVTLLVLSFNLGEKHLITFAQPSTRCNKKADIAELSSENRPWKDGFRGDNLQALAFPESYSQTF